MNYVAVPIEALIGDLSNDVEATVQFIALDGYAPVIAGKRLPKIGAARAYLAIEPSPGAWPPLGPNKPSPGPFYLVWTAAAGSGVTPGEWPWQLATIRVQESVAHRLESSHRGGRRRMGDSAEDHPHGEVQVEGDDPERGHEAQDRQDGVALLEWPEPLDPEDRAER